MDFLERKEKDNYFVFATAISICIATILTCFIMLIRIDNLLGILLFIIWFADKVLIKVMREEIWYREIYSMILEILIRQQK